MRKIVKISWIIIRSLLIFILLIFTTIAIVENIKTNKQINNFKKQGVYQEDISTDKIKYYRIASNEKSIEFCSNGDCIPGEKGDILCSTEQTTIAPIINEIISFYVGGHAGYISGSYNDYELYGGSTSVVESTTTNGMDTTTHFFSISDWQNNKFFNSVIGLRVKMTEEEKEEVTTLITSYIDDPYNSSFIFDTVNKKYCTDLITQAFDYINKDLNKDKSVVTIYDLIVSPDTYIYYYHYYDSKGIKYIYYLG